MIDLDWAAVFSVSPAGSHVGSLKQTKLSKTTTTKSHKT
jgi:hypothetical protein